ncbi:MAG: SDR family oxidoreductase [Hyphomicrobiaceae bacterium]
MAHLLCFGLGYSAGYLAERVFTEGWTVSCTTRTSDSADRARALGYAPIDIANSPEGLQAVLSTVTHLLVSAPPDRQGDPLLLGHAADIAAAPALAWIGYLSTIGVYGDRNGAWVDETSAPAPGSDRSRWRLEAEKAWLALGRSHRARVEIFRLPGIYGPGRSAIDTLRAGTARRIVKPGHVFNRIHVADIANTLAAAIATTVRHDIYNVTDDEPASSEEVLLFAARLLQMTPPPAIPLTSLDLSPMARSFYSECRRVSNQRIKKDLGVKLAHPTFRDGLRAIAAAAS